jgi:hypothetical protein
VKSVLVLGLPRGGTTWVGRALSQGPSTAYVHEPDGVHEPFAFRARFHDGLGNHVALCPGDGAPEYARLWSAVFAGGGRSQSFRDRLARSAYRGVPPEIRRRARDTHRASFRLEVAMRASRPLRPRPEVSTVVAKSVNAALAAEWISARFRPDVVVVTRDLRNVVGSWLDIGFGAPGEPAYQAIRREAARRWNVDIPTSNERVERTATICAVLLLALHEAARAHPEWSWIVHEQCSLDPEATFEAAAAKVGLPWEQAARDFVAASNRPGTGYSTNRVSREVADQWRSRLDDEQLAIIERVKTSFPGELWDSTQRA